MSFNLVSVISDFLPKEAIDRIATGLGITPDATQNVVTAAIPAVLGSLGSAAATSDGANRIAAQLQSQEPSMLEGLWSGLGGAEQGDISSYGTKLLSDLVGGAGPANLLNGALAKFTSVPGEITNSILGLVTPVALGAIANQAPQAVSSGAAVSELFASQKSAIQAALPAGLAASLGGILGGFTQNAGAAVNSAAAKAEDAARNLGSSIRNTTAPITPPTVPVEAPSAGMPSWVWPAVAVAALVLVGWYFMAQKKAPAPTPPAATISAPADAAAAFTKDATAVLGNVTQTLATVTNADTAKAALPKLQEADAQLGKLQSTLSGLPEAARKTASTQLSSVTAAVKASADKAMALPGVGDVLKPVVTPIMARLDALTKG